MEFNKYELNDSVVNQIIKSFPDLDKENYKTAFSFFRTAGMIFSSTESFFRIYELSQGRFFILQALFHNTANTNSTLAKEIGVTRPTITNLLKGLTDQGYISSNQVGEDKRKVEIILSQKGRELMGRLLPVYYENINLFWGKISSDDKKSLNSILYKLFQRGE